MQPLEIFPNIRLESNSTIAEKFLQRGLQTFHEACRWISDLPHGTNSNSANSLILFEEGYGNCTTKHGVIAHLAHAHNLPIHKNLGFYRLNATIAKGINALLAPYGLDFIPQTHCFLVYGEHWVDLTDGNCHGKNKTIEKYDFVIQVQPDLSRHQKEDYYREYLQRYGTISPQLAAMREEQVFELLTACDRQVDYQCSLVSDSVA